MKMKHSAIADDSIIYKKLVDSITDYAVYMLDTDGNVISWNSGAEKAKGYTEEEVIGRHFSIFYGEEDRAQGLPQRNLAIAEREGRCDSEGWRYRKDGSRFWAHVIIDPVFENGEVVGFAKVTRDASVLKDAQTRLKDALAAAEAANEAKSTFLAVMSHEIRTPLNGVLGMAQAMAAGELSEVQQGRLRVIRESGETLLAILNDILDLSKIEAGRLELDEVEFDLEMLLRGAYAAFTSIANDKGLSFCLNLERAKGVYRGDAMRVRQIVYNLLSNSLKFTSGGRIDVAATRTEEGLRLEVSDTGIGMSESTLTKVFSKFSQADASTTRQFGGTGLGLAICRQLAVLMGGEISVASTLGQGTTFTVELPLDYVGPPLNSETTISAEFTGPPLSDRALRVLGAEDNMVNQLVLKTMLNQVGIDPTMVVNGMQAVDAWQRGEWDLILMDVQMPEMDGPTATLAIRRLEAGQTRRRTPIFALSANAMPHQVAEYMAAGMDGHIAKPIQVRELFGVLDSVLEADQP